MRDNEFGPQLDISSSQDETFGPGFDDNTHGIRGLSFGHHAFSYLCLSLFGGGELAQAEMGKLAQQIKPLLGGGELSQAEMGKLSQQIKALELGFAAPQIRVVPMTDGKATAKMLKASNQDALKNIFSAAAKRIGLSPKAASAAPSFEPATSVVSPEQEDGWTTVAKKSKASC